jgi:hypothetical protein
MFDPFENYLADLSLDQRISLAVVAAAVAGVVVEDQVVSNPGPLVVATYSCQRLVVGHHMGLQELYL